MEKSDLNAAIRAAAMLATYHTTSWPARYQDAMASNAAAAAAGTDRAAYSTYKNLMYGADTRLKALRNVQATGRKIYLSFTLPWGGENERGIRMLPVVHWMPYMREIGALKAEFVKTRQEFVDNYDADVLIAQRKLNIGVAPVGLYPTAEQVATMFSMRPGFQPIPEGSQFKGLPPGVEQKLGEAFEERVATQMSRATSASLARAADNLTTFAERMDSSRMYRTTWELVCFLPESLRAFNVAKEPRADAIAWKIQKDLLGQISFDGLKDDEREKARARTIALELAAQIREEAGPLEDEEAA